MSFLRLALAPPADVSKADTGLRFTDILFGFVISQLFVRLQNVSQLHWFVRWQLIAGTALVLGSWIGFRRSLNRTSYEIKFFNLPFVRFILDQAMVILYFRVAVLTPTDLKSKFPAAQTLLTKTTVALALIFALYALWDLFGILMAHVNENGKPKDPRKPRDPKYPKINEEKEKTKERAKKDWPAFIITLGFLAGFVVLWVVANWVDLGTTGVNVIFAIATGLLILYRFTKEVKTSWQTRPNLQPEGRPGLKRP